MIRLGLIGYGYWGPNYARVIRESQSAVLSWCADKSPASLTSAAARNPGVRTTTDYHDLLSADDCDGVIIATPSATHAAIAREVIEAAKPVLVEKPIALSGTEARDLAALAARLGIVNMAAHVFLYNPAVRFMAQEIATGRLGAVRYLHSSRIGFGPQRADVDVLWDLAPHDVSIILKLLGSRPRTVQATGQSFLRPDHRDVVFATLQFPSGAVAGIQLSWISPYKERRLVVVGDQRTVRFDDVSIDEKIRVFDAEAPVEQRDLSYGEFKSITRQGSIVIPQIPYREPLKEQLLHFVDCIRERRTPETSLAQGADVVEVIEAIDASVRGVGELIRVG